MHKKAYALATVLVLLGVCLFGVGAVVTILGLEAKISRSQAEGLTAYYAADAGAADALWRLNNDAAYKAALLNGTLDATYTAANAPQAGQGFTVTLKTNPTKGAGYADITVDATSDNGTFVAKRSITTTVFAGQTTISQLGTNGILAGGNFATKSGVSSLNVSNAGIYARGAMSLQQTNVNVGSAKLQALGVFTQSQSNIYSGISASNYPPAPDSIAVPGVSFTDYAAAASQTFTAKQFSDAIKNSSGAIDFSGPITYVDGDVLLNGVDKNKSVGIHGVLVVNGDFTINNGATNLVMNFYDPGDGKSGLLVSKNLDLAQGNINVDGIVYAAGTIGLTGLPALNIQGAMVAGGNITFTSLSSVNVTFNQSRADAIFGIGGTVQALEVEHWEEEY